MFPTAFWKSGAAVYDPAVLALQGWWRASYSGSPWTGTASAGGSNGRNISEATNPPATGAAVNGRTSADFDGSNDQLTTATACTTFVSDAAGSLFCLFYADAAAADPGTAGYYSNPSFFVNDGDGYLGFGFNAAGVVLGSYDSTSGTFDSVGTACATGGWHLGQARWDNSAGGGAGLMEVRVDSGGWTTMAKLVEVSLSANGVRVGTSFTGAFFFDGKILELGAAQTKFSDATFDNIKSYVNARYALSL